MRARAIGAFQFGVPFSFGFDQPSYRISTSMPWVRDVELSDFSAYCLVGSDHPLFKLCGTAVLVLAGVVFLYIVHQLRRVFASLRRGVPFTLNNVRRIIRIGIVILLIAFLSSAYKTLAPGIMDRYFDFEGVEIRTGLSLDYPLILFALLVLILAEVFRVGVEIEHRPEIPVDSARRMIG